MWARYPCMEREVGIHCMRATVVGGLARHRPHPPKARTAQSESVPYGADPCLAPSAEQAVGPWIEYRSTSIIRNPHPRRITICP